MTRLRLAPSSPERMAVQIRTLVRDIYWTQSSGWVSSWNRGARLMLRWYAQGHVNHQWAHEQILEHGRPSLSDYYGTAWRSTYPDQLWPQDGDDRLRRELDEKEKDRC